MRIVCPVCGVVCPNVCCWCLGAESFIDGSGVRHTVCRIDADIRLNPGYQVGNIAHRYLHRGHTRRLCSR
jgi:hypothetical protein